MAKVTPTLAQRTMLIRAALTGSNGQHLMDFLMDEYVYRASTATDAYMLAKEAGERELVLYLRRMTKE